MTQPLQLFAEITRIDEEARIVEGFCRTTGRVKSDPYDLTFRALKKASGDYLEWSNVREMHGASAAGTCLNLDFLDAEERIFIRAEISDDQAWRKVKSKTYKGFSIGGRPTLLRGNEVVEFQWTEISLVDRPADPGATITLFRRDELADVEPHEATEEELARADYPGGPDYSAGDAGANLPAAENLETPASRLVGSMHYDCGSLACHGHKQHAAAQRCQMARVDRGDIHIPDEATDEEAAAIVRVAAVTPLQEGAEPPATPEAAPEPAPTTEEPDDMTLAELTTRLDTLQAENAALVVRLDALTPQTEAVTRIETALTQTQATVTRLETERAEMAAEIKRLGDAPASTPPMRFTQALSREHVQRMQESLIPEAARVKLARLAEIGKLAVPADRREAEGLATEALQLQSELRQLGVSA